MTIPQIRIEYKLDYLRKIFKIFFSWFSNQETTVASTQSDGVYFYLDKLTRIIISIFTNLLTYKKTCISFISVRKQAYLEI